MATLLAENIMRAVVSKLAVGLEYVTVERGRVDPFPDGALPGIGIYQGADEPREEGAWPFIDSLLEVRTEVAARGETLAEVESALNDLRRRVHLLMMEPGALALAYVVDIVPIGTDEPTIEPGAERLSGSMVVRWGIHYRSTWIDSGEAP
jgi:hypothetical protein